jgi:hypothetical protein
MERAQIAHAHRGHRTRPALTEEIAVYTHLVWRKSSRSSGGGNQCVEVAFARGGTALRDSKNPAGGVLVMPAAGWRMFRCSLSA